LNAYQTTFEKVRFGARAGSARLPGKGRPMNHPTLDAHLQQADRRPEPLRVLVVHDGLLARRRVERLLLRIRSGLGTKLRLDCDFRRLAELGQRDERAKKPRLELVFLAASCSATLPQENLAGITALLPTLKSSHGALAFLSGTVVPRRLDSMLIEQFLRTCAKRAGVAFFSGGLPGLGCPGCGAPRREKPARSKVKRFCVLHAPKKIETSPSGSCSPASQPIKTKMPPARPAKARIPVRVVSKRQPRLGRPGQRAHSS